MLFVGNRSFLLVKPKKPLVDWVNGYDESKISEETILAHKTLYMVENLETDLASEKEGIIKRNCKKIFEHELKQWSTDKKHFPKKLSFEYFNEWFEYEFIEMCFDTLHDEIILE